MSSRLVQRILQDPTGTAQQAKAKMLASNASVITPPVSDKESVFSVTPTKITDSFTSDKSSMSVTPSSTKSLKESSPSSKLNFSSMPTCAKCSKSVCPSSPEELNAMSKIWHKSCFVCGGTNLHGKGCGKTLTLLNYVEHEYQPFCQKCHSNIWTDQDGSSKSPINLSTNMNVVTPTPSNKNSFHSLRETMPTTNTAERLGNVSLKNDGDEVDESEW